MTPQGAATSEMFCLEVVVATGYNTCNCGLYSLPYKIVYICSSEGRPYAEINHSLVILFLVTAVFAVINLLFNQRIKIRTDEQYTYIIFLRLFYHRFVNSLDKLIFNEQLN